MTTDPLDVAPARRLNQWYVPVGTTDYVARGKTAMSDHADLLARHRRVLPSWLALYYDQPIELASGEGRHVTDGEGRRYLDFFGGILTTMTGYAVPEVVKNTLAPGMPDRAEMRSASSTIGRMR